MNNEELKKKIVEIIDTTKKPCECLTVSECLRYENCKYQKREEWSCKAYAIAEALIAAGIGDVKEAEMAANRYEMLYSMQARDMALAERNAFTYAAEIEHLNNKLNEAEHRAEVAERAGRIIQRDMARVFDISNPRVCELIANIWDLAKKQAEKELAEEEKNEGEN